MSGGEICYPSEVAEAIGAVVRAARAWVDAPPLDGRGGTDEEMSREERGALSEMYRAVKALDALGSEKKQT